MTIDDESILMYGGMMVAIELLEGCPEYGPLVPEVRSNVVYARRSATTVEDVMAVDGRITATLDGVRASGRPRFGASSHMARMILGFMEEDPSVRAAVNMRADTEHLTTWLEDHARSMGWTFAVVDRSREPEEIHAVEDTSTPWKVAEALQVTGGSVPKLFYGTGSMGKEPVGILTGPDPVTVCDEVTQLARLYAGAMDRH
jgi:hydroxymethylpyrimidine/phosphomethylpyrimidine kinase